MVASGPDTYGTYKAEFLCANLGVIAKLPKHVADAFKAAERPAIIVGGGPLRPEGAHGAALAFAKHAKLGVDGWNGLNVLHLPSARPGGRMLPTSVRFPSTETAVAACGGCKRCDGRR